MSLAVQNDGVDNTISIADSIGAGGSGKLLVKGNRNKITIDATDYTFGGTVQITGDDNNLFIGRNINCRHLFVHMAGNSSIKIERGVSFNGSVRLLLHEPSSISIGAGCLFASEIDITVSDMHSIIDLATGKRTNHARPIWIGERVWIGQRVMILKGVSLGDGSVVAAGSTVTRDIPRNCLAAGSPATVIREGIGWDSRLL